MRAIKIFFNLKNKKMFLIYFIIKKNYLFNFSSRKKANPIVQKIHFVLKFHLYLNLLDLLDEKQNYFYSIYLEILSKAHLFHRFQDFDSYPCRPGRIEIF